MLFCWCRIVQDEKINEHRAVYLFLHTVKSVAEIASSVDDGALMITASFSTTEIETIDD